jgi:hypothetical protein
MANRLTAMIELTETDLKGLEKAKHAKLTAALALDTSEVIGWQTAQAEAHASGMISTDEAQFIYVAIGPAGGNWKRQTLATRIVITQAMHTLLSNQIAARRQQV